jgi:hypothetical protein
MTLCTRSIDLSTIMAPSYRCPGIGCNASFGSVLDLVSHMSGAYHPLGSFPSASRFEVKTWTPLHCPEEDCTYSTDGPRKMRKHKRENHPTEKMQKNRRDHKMKKQKRENHPEGVRNREDTRPNKIAVADSHARAILSRKAYLHQRHMDNMSINRPRILDRYF